MGCILAINKFLCPKVRGLFRTARPGPKVMLLFVNYDGIRLSSVIFALCCAITTLAYGQADSSRLPAQAGDCAALMSWKLEGTIIASAAEVPAGTPVTLSSQGPQPPIAITSLPTHCVVRGEVNHHTGADGKSYGDKFELRMPKQWGGRFLFQGGGGLDGNLFPALALDGRPQADSKSPLSRGYAIVSTDAGHQAANPTADGAFGSDPESRADTITARPKSLPMPPKPSSANFMGGLRNIPTSRDVQPVAARE